MAISSTQNPPNALLDGAIKDDLSPVAIACLVMISVLFIAMLLVSLLLILRRAPQSKRQVHQVSVEKNSQSIAEV